MYERILVPLGGSHFAETALPHAMGLAARWGAALELAMVADAGATGSDGQKSGSGGDEAREGSQARAESYLEQVEERIRAGGFGGEIGHSAIPAGNIATALVRHLGPTGADFVVMTTHGRGPVRRAWLGSAADGFIRRSPVPVLLIRPEEASGEEGAPPAAEPPDLSGRPQLFRRILVPLDGSEEAERVLDVAAPLAEGGEATLFLFRAVPPFIPGGSPYLPHVVRETQDHERIKRSAEEYLQELEGRVGFAKPEVRVVTSGQPAVAILNAVPDEEVDLIAMTTSGRGGVARLLLGSVADKVVRGSPVPVLIFRDQDEV